MRTRWTLVAIVALAVLMVWGGLPYPVEATNTITLNVRDTDGDRCNDRAELQTAEGSQGQGGLRDPENPYDYMNPTKDGVNRTDDILAVVDQYRIDDPPGRIDYNSQTDRTYLGPNPWNLGPPNGLQRTDDILAAVDQYRHDCTGAFTETVDLDAECNAIVKEDGEPAGAPELGPGETYIECYIYRDAGTGEVMDLAKTILTGPEIANEGDDTVTVSGKDFPMLVAALGIGEAAAVPVRNYRCESQKKYESLIFHTDLAKVKVILRGWIVVDQSSPYYGGVGFRETWKEVGATWPWSVSNRNDTITVGYTDIYQAYRLQARTYSGFHAEWTVPVPFLPDLTLTEDMELHVSTTLGLNDDGVATCWNTGYNT